MAISPPGAHAPQHDLRVALRDVFGYEEFRPCQEEIVRAVMAGHDTLAVLPTGAGKSLCYQLPAALLPGPTLVISPLISLMKDQVDNLPPKLFGKSTVINSTVSLSEIDERMRGIRSGAIRLVYAAPERLRQHAFLSHMREAALSMVVVDEAHCVSMWGHDFRPDYLFIRKALEMLAASGSSPTLLAVTATATPDMQREVAIQLGRPLDVVVAPLFRENLRLAVHPCANIDDKKRALIRICAETQGAGIVYANSRDRCEDLAAMLRRERVRAEHYHAGLDPGVRRDTQDRFMLGETRIIVATVAFGMGIDKANVRLVAHFSLPQSLESYAQEAGRAGRDGKPSTCALLYSPADRGNLTRWLKAESVHLEDVCEIYNALKGLGAADGQAIDADELTAKAFGLDDRDDKRTTARVAIAMMEACGMLVRHPDAGRNLMIEMLPAPKGARQALEELIARRDAHAEDRLDGIVGYATTGGCRHAALVRHFGQTMEPCERACDTCLGSASALPASAAAPGIGVRQTVAVPADVGRVILSAVADLPFGLGRTGLAKVLHGSADAALKPSRCKAHGALSGMTRTAIERAIESLVKAELLEIIPDDDYRRLRLTREGTQASSGEDTVLAGAKAQVARKQVATKSSFGDLTDQESDRFELLRAWRRGVATKAGVPGFVVFHDAALKCIARANPTTAVALAAVPGVGQTRTDKYGSAILDLLRRHAEGNPSE